MSKNSLAFCAHLSIMMGDLRFKHLVRLCLALIGALILWAMFAPLPVYASDCGPGLVQCIDTVGDITSVPITVAGTCDDRNNWNKDHYGLGVRVIGVDNDLNHSLGFTPMSGAVSTTDDAGGSDGRTDWELEWAPVFNGIFKIRLDCYNDTGFSSVTSDNFTVNAAGNYSNFNVEPTNAGAGWIAMVVAPGKTETIAPVATGDLVLVIEDTNSDSESDAESVDEVFPAGTEFTLSYDMPRIDPLRSPRRTPYALFCMADCQSWSYSEPTLTATVKTVRQVKSNGDVRESSLGFITSLASSMEVVEGSHFSGIGVHYSDMSSTDPRVLSKRTGYSVNGFTGTTATFKMFAPFSVLDWMGITNPMEQWTGFLGDDVSNANITKTRVAGGWLMEFDFTFASNKKPGSGPPPPAEPNNSGYWAEKFSGVVFDDYQGLNVSTGGNSFSGGADYITFSGDTICIEPPVGFSATGLHVNQSTWYSGASCYTSTDGARVDFGISQVPTAAPTAAATATPIGQAQGTVSSSGGTVSNVSSGVTLTFPSGAVPDGSIATISPLTVGETPTIGAGFSLVDTVVEIIVRDAGGNTLSDFSANPVRMCFDYTAGQLLAAGGDTTNLEIVRNPGLTDEGAITSNRAVDNDAQQICVDVTQFSTWAMAARVPTALPVTGTMTYLLLISGVVAVVLLLSGGVALQWRRRHRS